MFASLFRGEARKRHLLTLVPYLKRYRKQLVVGIFMVLLTNLVAVLIPWILGSAIDRLSQELRRDLLLYFALLIVGASALEGFFRFHMRRILIGVSRYLEYDLRNDLFAHLQTLSPRFFQKYPTGDLMSRATNDLSAVRMVLGPGIMYSINTVFTAVLTVAILIRIEFRLAVLTLIPLIIVSYSVKYFGKQIHRRFEKIQEQFSNLTALAQENVAGIRVVKSYNQESAFIQRMRQANNDYLRKSLSLVKISGLYTPLVAFLLGLSAVALLWYGGTLVINGTISLGQLVAFMAYLAMLTWPTIALGWVINIFERGSASMARINEILGTEPEIRDAAPLPLESVKGRIEVRNLTFSYNGSPVLNNISFEVNQGETLAIVGSTGSGKSTLVNLLCRLYPVARGTVFIDGHDINDIPLKVLRNHIGYVPQETFLFSETIAENIAFGSIGAEKEAIVESARVSNVWPDIEEFPDQLQTFVGERGVTLSGGQKQRIAISRALLPSPAILILDDALSSVDTHTEEQILQRLADELKGRTAILISHRISTVKMADHILVLEGGETMERGTHEELLAQGGYYADLYERQLLKEELGME
jgi:ATP-binding cassette, subfamily B, multidrug efflux pump